MPGDRAGVAGRAVPPALLAPLLAAAATACVLYGVALSSDDEGVMRLANGSVPAVFAMTMRLRAPDSDE